MLVEYIVGLMPYISFLVMNIYDIFNYKRTGRVKQSRAKELPTVWKGNRDNIYSLIIVIVTKET